jgi:hypothetical protein
MEGFRRWIRAVIRRDPSRWMAAFLRGAAFRHRKRFGQRV